REALVVQPPADFADLFLELVFVLVFFHDSTQLLDHHLVENAGTESVHRLAFRKKGSRRLAAFAEANAITIAGAQVVENHQVRPMGSSPELQGLQGEGNANDPAALGEDRMGAG